MPAAGRGAPPRRPAERHHPLDRHEHPGRPAHDRSAHDRAAHDRAAQRRPSPRPAPAARPAPQGGRLPGIAALLLAFLVGLAGAGVDSFVGVGLGRITLGALLAGTALATILVRRRSLFSVVVAPPLLFGGIAAVNVALAPSASFDLPTVVTLLVRGAPTMVLATAAALLIALVRVTARR
jgi:hypothetical protein